MLRGLGRGDLVMASYTIVFSVHSALRMTTRINGYMDMTTIDVSNTCVTYRLSWVLKDSTSNFEVLCYAVRNVGSPSIGPERLKN